MSKETINLSEKSLYDTIQIKNSEYIEVIEDSGSNEIYLNLLKDKLIVDINKNFIGISDVTNDKQVKAIKDQVVENNIVTLGSDGSIIKDSGFTIKTSVPENAEFTDTIYTHPNYHPSSMINGLSKVATSGDYNDLSNLPNFDETYESNHSHANKLVLDSITQTEMDRLKTINNYDDSLINESLLLLSEDLKEGNIQVKTSEKLNGFDISHFATSLDLQSVNVKSYGCIGNGIVDDTLNFQLAIDDAITKGKILFIDKGNYLITNRLYIKFPLTIIGSSNTESIINFVGETFTEEIDYDLINYKESHAVICIQSSNVILSNFKLFGGFTTDTASLWNGIIFHYPHTNIDTGITNYSSAERVNISQLNIDGFNNGILVYGGWNRYILTTQIRNCRIAGINYKSLEIATVGKWSASGDIIQSCQIVGCDIGYKAEGNYESTLQNTIFEYNNKAIWVNSCKDIYIINCWNEANNSNIYISGSARIKGGYNILPTTVDHVNIFGNDTVTIELDNETYVKQGEDVVFYQTGGIITKGVSLGSKKLNLIVNNTFGTIAVPSLTNWEATSLFLVKNDNEIKFDDNHNSIKITCDPIENWENDPDYGIFSDPITIDPTKDYNFSFKLYTKDKTIINKGIKVMATFKKGTETIAYKTLDTIFMIGNNTWEDYSFLVNASLLGCNDATSVRLGIMVIQYGIIYISCPIFSLSSISSDVLELRKTEVNDIYNLFDQNGILYNQLDNSSSHSHTNKTVLDGITDALITSWNTVTNKQNNTTYSNISGDSVVLTLTDNTVFTCTTNPLTSLTINLPTIDLACEINFNSGSSTSLTVPSVFKVKGDDVVNNVFVPVSNKHYTLIIYKSNGIYYMAVGGFNE